MKNLENLKTDDIYIGEIHEIYHNEMNIHSHKIGKTVVLMEEDGYKDLLYPDNTYYDLDSLTTTETGTLFINQSTLIPFNLFSFAYPLQEQITSEEMKIKSKTIQKYFNREKTL